jgi:hypothetical protein
MAAGTLANSMNWAFWLCNGPAPWVSPRGSTARVRRHIIRTCHEMSAYQHSVTLKYNTQLAKQPERWRTRRTSHNRVQSNRVHDYIYTRYAGRKLAWGLGQLEALKGQTDSNVGDADHGATRLRVPVGCSVLVCVYDGRFQHPGSRRTAPRSQPTGVGVPDVDVPPATSDERRRVTGDVPSCAARPGAPVTPVDLAVLATSDLCVSHLT